MKPDRDLFLRVLILIAVVITIGNTFFAYREIDLLYQSTEAVVRTRTVLRSLDQLMSTAKDAETGQRGFIITGDAAYLEPYYTATTSISGRLENVDSLTRDEPLVQAQLPNLRGYLATKMDELRQTIALRQSEGLAAAEEMVKSGEGRATMDSIRTSVERMSAAVEPLLEERTTIAHRQRNSTMLLMAAEGALELLTLFGLAWAMRRHLRIRTRNAVELFEQKEMFRTTLASIGDAVITTDTQGRVRFLNDVAERLTGWMTSDAAGRPLETVFHIINESSRQPVANPAVRALSEGVIVGLANHTLLIARDGNEKPIDDSAAPIRDVHGATTGAVLVFRDITETKAAEHALIEADQRKDEFLAVLAHELRNPLAPLRNALEILRLSQHDAVAVEQAGGIMERQLQQMVRLIDDLLDVSRITRNRLDLRTEIIDIASVIHAATETTSPLLRGSGHTLRVTLPPAPVYVSADRTRLAQAFGNLLSNAIKYTDRGGSIWLSVTPDQHGVSVSVRDDGVGIPPEMFEKIFEMFVQVDRSLERTRGGLGIGLPLVKQIVTMHGGTITTQSGGAGRGSEFIVSLPTVAAPAEEAPSTTASDSVQFKHRILIADDNPDAADSLATMLRMMGHETCVARDGVEALSEGAVFRPDVALLDIGMPNLNGYDTARRIRQADWGRKVILIALTGWGQDEDRARSMEAGFDRHMVKPVELAELRKVLQTS